MLSTPKGNQQDFSMMTLVGKDVRQDVRHFGMAQGNRRMHTVEKMHCVGEHAAGMPPHPDWQGSVLAAARVHTTPWSQQLQGDLNTQHLPARSELLVMTSQAVYRVERRCPVDVLEEILADTTNCADRLMHFKNDYSARELACMCLILITKPRSSQMQAAKRIFEDHHLMGEARFSMEQIGPTAQEPLRGGLQFSDAWIGLTLYACRLLIEVWNKPIARRGQRAEDPMECNLIRSDLMLGSNHLDQLEQRKQSLAELDEMRNRVQALQHFIDERVGPRVYHAAPAGPQVRPVALRLMNYYQHKVRVLPGAGAFETEEFQVVGELMRFAKEALQLVIYTVENHFGRTLEGLTAEQQESLCQMPSTSSRISKQNQPPCVATANGHQNCKLLVGRLMENFVKQQPSPLAPGAAFQLAGQTPWGGSKGERSDEMSNKLKDHCPTFFGAETRAYFQASALLQQVSPGHL
ncbi:hypothetical protein CYMTET_18584 [Cymbomonas tetramitiformis]|uniref:Uncharacterized protein n=1 Tax=Cymbomonas tetramitiformis TaxID=36881 RepID=A0AAE0G7R3_9CHLO|nr:hypothetical protein CYMTET_18584 [Cymbomonas tetramitiformis]